MFSCIFFRFTRFIPFSIVSQSLEVASIQFKNKCQQYQAPSKTCPHPMNFQTIHSNLKKPTVYSNFEWFEWFKSYGYFLLKWYYLVFHCTFEFFKSCVSIIILIEMKIHAIKCNNGKLYDRYWPLHKYWSMLKWKSLRVSLFCKFINSYLQTREWCR